MKIGICNVDGCSFPTPHTGEHSWEIIERQVKQKLGDAIEVVLEYVEEWAYEDNPRSNNYCRSCGWNTHEHQKQFSDGLSHHEGCKLRAAMDFLEAYRENIDGL